MTIEEKFDAIVVGGGLAGLSCAYTLAKSGKNVVVLERGDYSGAKNVMGGVLFTPILEKLMPEFIQEAPLERYIKEHKYSLLSKDTELKFSFKTEKHNSPPHNHSFSVMRANFDKWFSDKVEEAGAIILTNVVVDELIWKDDKCVGVKSRLEEGNLFADAVVLAEGANSVLAEKEGLKELPEAGSMAVAAKEVISLPEEVIEERFGLNRNEGNGAVPEGVSSEYFGDAVQGMFANAFIYTNRDSLSVGIGCPLNELAEKETNPHDILEYFKNHPCVRNLLRGGKTEEYSAHMIPEGGYKKMPKMVFNGLLITGDCAGLLNTSFFHEGSNLAMASGVYAAEAIIEAAEKKDFSKKALLPYERKLQDSFVIKDMKKFKNFLTIGQKCPEIVSEYPEALSDMILRYFTVSEKPKKVLEREVFGMFRKKFGFLRLGRNMFSMIRAMGWI